MAYLFQTPSRSEIDTLFPVVMTESTDAGAESVEDVRKAKPSPIEINSIIEGLVGTVDLDASSAAIPWPYLKKLVNLWMKIHLTWSTYLLSLKDLKKSPHWGQMGTCFIILTITRLLLNWLAQLLIPIFKGIPSGHRTFCNSSVETTLTILNLQNLIRYFEETSQNNFRPPTNYVVWPSERASHDCSRPK